MKSFATDTGLDLSAGSTSLERSSAVILVVDDDEDLRGVVGDILRDEGFSVVEAENGQVALDYIFDARTTPALILLDLNMPVMSGREMLGVLRSYLRFSTIPVLITTSEVPSVGVQDEGSVARLQKPYSSSDLLGLLRRYIPARP